MFSLWLQVGLLGLTPREQREWRRWANDSLHRDSVLRSWGYWAYTASHAGPKHRLEALSCESDSALQSITTFLRRERGRVLTPILLDSLSCRLQKSLANQGFLYASVRWERLTCDTAGRCSAHLRVEAGEVVRLDTILLHGRWPAPRSAFYQITGLRPKEPLSLARWEALPRRLRSSPYAVVVDTPRLWLFPGLAWAELTVQPKVGNRIDGALSLLPASSDRVGSQPQVIGQAEVALLSPFRLGERIEARFAQLPNRSQKLFFLTAFPYLLRGYVEVQGSLSLWRQDTSFLTRETEAMLRYRITPTLSILTGYQTTVSRLISTVSFRDRVWPPPPVLDFRRWGLRLGWQYEQLDFRIAPRRGWKITLIGIQGRRGYLRNPGLPNLAYERLPSFATFWEVQASLSRYFPIGKLFSVRGGAMGYRYLVGSYFENELPRAGGSASFRSFPENTFPTAGYLHAFLEGRLHLDEESFLGIFVEGTQLDLFKRGETFLQGVGILLQTRLAAGLLQVTFAAGKAGQEPLNLRRALVRLEWLSEF